jgi:hypothetical protein
MRPNRRARFGFTSRLLNATLVVASTATLAGLADRSPDSAGAAADQTVAMYEMNEPLDATVLVDSSGSGLNGAIGPNIVTAATFDGAIGHRFANRSPTMPPTEPERLDTVPESDILDPGTSDWAVTVRYRTSHPFGNLIQKGQNNTFGGYFKIELPFGRPTCLFIGEDANGNELKGGTEAPVGFEIDDNQWHTVRCERLQNRVALYIDGVEVNRNVGPTGTINNTKNLSIAGKSNCDQISTTCDYFVGDIDWVQIEKGEGVAQNVPPHASFVKTCPVNVCTLNASASDDPDGSIVAWDWDFDDGTTGTGEIATHEYTAGGSYTVSLTVTDNGGATDTTTRTFTVKAPPPTTTSTTSTTSTTTTTIVDQLPPEGLVVVPGAADGGAPAKRMPAFDATDAADSATADGD